ncbi:MAG: GntR family transcriptional regulator [Flavobacteriaceae bacterium]
MTSKIHNPLIYITEIIEEKKVVNTLSKHEQLVQGIMQVIDAGNLPIGAQMPSINSMVDRIGFARKTIVKAYEELKERGLIESQKAKGYFVISNNTEVVQRVALLLYAFQRFQQEFYDSLREELGEKAHIDVYFHHNNNNVFETIFKNIQGKYSMYIVAPLMHDISHSLLKRLPKQKLIIVDRFFDLGTEYTYVTQEFFNSTKKIFQRHLDKISDYQNIVLFYNNYKDYPEEIRNAFYEFIQINHLSGTTISRYSIEELNKDTLYICLSDSDLWPLLRDSTKNGLKISKDIGVISFNDHIVKEITLGGITTISTDFKLMGKRVAHLIQTPSSGKIIIPTTSTDRGSF